MSLTILDISCKWNYAVVLCNQLISFNIMSSRFINVEIYEEFLSFLELHNILLFVYATIFFFIDFSIDGHLDHSHLLAIVNIATINMGVQICT